jgi:hypothetical protein
MCDSDATTINYKMTSITAENMYMESISIHSEFHTPPPQEDSDTELDIEVSILNASPLGYGESIFPNLHVRSPSRGVPDLMFPECFGDRHDVPEFPDFSDNKDPPTRTELTLPDGSIVAGTKYGNRTFWRGMCTFEDGVYNGDLVNSMREGFGTLTSPDGSTYRGYWFNNKRHGEGEEKLQDGTIYDGDWVNDRKNGWGVTTYLDGTEHKGDWKDGVKKGWGRIIYGTGNDKLRGRIYSGNWRTDGDNLYGKGEILYPNGDTYNGDWLTEARHGSGIHKTAGGNIYIGTWENDEAVLGDVIYSDGTKSTGIRWQSISRMLQAP